MKEEELIKKLESVKLPSIELQSHRRRLRMALLNADYLQRRPGVTILDLAKSKVKGGIDTMIRGLVSRQPVWKTAVAGVLAIALIAGLVIALPLLTKQSPVALAAEIAKNSPEVQAALGSEEIKAVRVLEIVDQKGTVLVQAEMVLVAAKVDLETKEVIEVYDVLYDVPVPELTAADEQKAINIAKADPELQELFKQGATISKIQPTRALIFKEVVDPDGEIIYEGLVSTDLMVMIYLTLGEEVWQAQIDLAGERVLAVHRLPGWDFDELRKQWERRES